MQKQNYVSAIDTPTVHIRTSLGNWLGSVWNMEVFKFSNGIITTVAFGDLSVKIVGIRSNKIIRCIVIIPITLDRV